MKQTIDRAPLFLLSLFLCTASLLAQDGLPQEIGDRRSQKEEINQKAPEKIEAIKASDYCSFLNAVAATEKHHHLYTPAMESQILRITGEDNDAYSVIEEKENESLCGLTQHDVMRYNDWVEKNTPSPLMMFGSTSIENGNATRKNSNRIYVDIHSNDESSRTTRTRTDSNLTDSSIIERGNPTIGFKEETPPLETVTTAPETATPPVTMPAETAMMSDITSLQAKVAPTSLFVQQAEIKAMAAYQKSLSCWFKFSQSFNTKKSLYCNSAISSSAHSFSNLEKAKKALLQSNEATADLYFKGALADHAAAQHWMQSVKAQASWSNYLQLENLKNRAIWFEHQASYLSQVAEWSSESVEVMSSSLRQCWKKNIQEGLTLIHQHQQTFDQSTDSLNHGTLALMDQRWKLLTASTECLSQSLETRNQGQIFIGSLWETEAQQLQSYIKTITRLPFGTRRIPTFKEDIEHNPIWNKHYQNVKFLMRASQAEAHNLAECAQLWTQAVIQHQISFVISQLATSTQLAISTQLAMHNIISSLRSCTYSLSEAANHWFIIKNNQVLLSNRQYRIHLEETKIHLDIAEAEQEQIDNTIPSISLENNPLIKTMIENIFLDNCIERIQSQIQIYLIRYKQNQAYPALKKETDSSLN